MWCRGSGNQRHQTRTARRVRRWAGGRFRGESLRSEPSASVRKTRRTGRNPARVASTLRSYASAVGPWPATDGSRSARFSGKRRRSRAEIVRPRKPRGGAPLTLDAGCRMGRADGVEPIVRPRKPRGGDVSNDARRALRGRCGRRTRRRCRDRRAAARPRRFRHPARGRGCSGRAGIRGRATRTPSSPRSRAARR